MKHVRKIVNKKFIEDTVNQTDDSGVVYTKNDTDNTTDETDWEIDKGLAAEKARLLAKANAAKKKASEINKKLKAMKKKKLTQMLVVDDDETPSVAAQPTQSEELDRTLDQPIARVSPYDLANDNLVILKPTASRTQAQ